MKRKAIERLRAKSAKLRAKGQYLPCIGQKVKLGFSGNILLEDRIYDCTEKTEYGYKLVSGSGSWEYFDRRMFKIVVIDSESNFPVREYVEVENHI